MRRHLPGLALVAVALGAYAPAYAKPSSASVGTVERCSTSTCQSAQSIAQGTVLTGTIRIEAKAQSGLVGLERVRLEALPPDKANAAEQEVSWVCLEQWFGDRRLSFSETYVWSTPIWPDPPKNSQCSEGATHFHNGKPSLDGTYQLRVRAWDVQDDTPTASPTFAIKFANPPAVPAWAGDPSASDGPVVSLHWTPNREGDVAEYRFVRVDPDGRAAEFAVDAKKPAAQGCSKVSSLYYACSDRGFGGERSGTYRYALVALRPAPGAIRRCALSGAPCVESGLSASREVQIVVPASVAASPTASTSAAATQSAKPAAHGSAPAAPSAVPQTEAQRHEALLGGKRRLPVSLPAAAGTLALGVAGALLYLLWKGRISAAAKP